MKLQSIEKFKEKRQSKLDFKRLCKFKAQTDPSTIDSIEILHKYQNGYNLSEIAKYLGCSRNRAYVICKGYNAKTCVQLPDGVIYKVLKLYNKNYTKEKIAKKCKLKLSMLRKKIENYDSSCKEIAFKLVEELENRINNLRTIRNKY